jgi:hypothetical protein
VVGCGCLQWGEVVYGRECGCLSLVGRSCLRLVEVVCSGEWFSPPLLPSTAASTTASLSTAALSPCCPIHRNLISRSRGPINCRLIQRFRTGQMSNSPRGVVGAGSRYERQSTGSVSYSSPPSHVCCTMIMCLAHRISVCWSSLCPVHIEALIRARWTL